MNTNWLDERIRLGETPAGSQAKAHQRESSPDGQAAQEHLALSDADILGRLPPERMAERIRQRAQSGAKVKATSSWNFSQVALVASLLIAAVFLLPNVFDSVITPGAPTLVDKGATGTTQPPATTASTTPPAGVQPNPRIPPQDVIVADAGLPDDGIRLRGDGALTLFIVAPDGVTEPTDSSVTGGSTLRIVAPYAANAGVWSIDETGNIQKHWPVVGDSSAVLPAGPLPRDWETDPSAGWDRFILVQAATPFALKNAEAHLRGLVASKHARNGRITLPKPLATTSTLVERAKR